MPFEFEFAADDLKGWLATTPRNIRAAEVRALSRTAAAVAGTAQALARKRGVIRRIFGSKPSGLRKLIFRGKLRVLPSGVIEYPVVVKGLAAFQELGGKLGGHVIRPKKSGPRGRAGVLAFGVKGGFGFGGDLVFARYVIHPGGMMPATPFLREAAQRRAGRLQEELTKELARVLGRGKTA